MIGNSMENHGNRPDTRILIHNLKEVTQFLNQIDDSTRTRIIVMDAVNKLNNIIALMEMGDLDKK